MGQRKRNDGTAGSEGGAGSDGGNCRLFGKLIRNRPRLSSWWSLQASSRQCFAKRPLSNRSRGSVASLARWSAAAARSRASAMSAQSFWSTAFRPVTTAICAANNRMPNLSVSTYLQYPIPSISAGPGHTVHCNAVYSCCDAAAQSIEYQATIFEAKPNQSLRWPITPSGITTTTSATGSMHKLVCSKLGPQKFTFDTAVKRVLV
jgi:hypothetical protein